VNSHAKVVRDSFTLVARTERVVLMVTEQQRRGIRDFGGMGLRHRTVARIVGCRTEQVRQVLSREPKDLSEGPFSPEFTAEVLRLSQREFSPKQIADILGVKIWKVYRVRSERQPLKQHLFNGGRGHRLTEVTKRALRRDHRQLIRTLAERNGIAVRTLRRIIQEEL
jgi:hypothetical protein